MYLKFLKSSGPLNWDGKKAKNIPNFRIKNGDIWTVNRREKSHFCPIS